MAHAPTVAFMTKSERPMSTAVGATSLSFEVSSAISIMTIIIPIGTPAPSCAPSRGRTWRRVRR